MSASSSTLDYYQHHAKSFVDQTFNVDMSKVYMPFLQALPNDSQKILDIGCGSGRDAIHFAKLGYRVTAIDASQPLIEWAKTHDSTNLVEWQCLTFEDLLTSDWQGKFDGIWACASLLHCPFNELTTLLAKLSNCLNKNGILYASFKYGDNERYDNERFFCHMNEIRWQLLIQYLGLSTLNLWLTKDNRSQNSQVWFNVLMRKTY